MSNLTNEEITDIWEAMPGQPGGWLKEFGYIQFARAIEKETASRCSTDSGITSLEGLHSYDEFGTKIYRSADVERLLAAPAAVERPTGDLTDESAPCSEGQLAELDEAYESAAGDEE
jgi:hypothetical protein